MRRRRDQQQQELVEAFLQEYNRLSGRAFRIPEAWWDTPDAQRPGCDALALGGEQRLAIEHTTLDAFVGEREDYDRFRQVVEALQDGQEIRRAACEHGLFVTLWVDVGTVRKGQSWPKHQAILRDWVLANLCRFAPMRQRYEVAGLPYPVSVSATPAQRRAGVFVGRNTPGDSLVDAVAKCLKKKDPKLVSYHRCGDRTVLLVETSNIALMSENRFRDALSLAQEQVSPCGIDEIWYVESAPPTTAPRRDWRLRFVRCWVNPTRSA